MPNIKSAIKRNKQNKKNNARNRMNRSTYRTAVKKFLNLIQTSNLTEAEQKLPKLHKEIDKAAKKGILKKETASRKKSRVTMALNRLKSKSA